MPERAGSGKWGGGACHFDRSVAEKSRAGRRKISPLRFTPVRSSRYDGWGGEGAAPTPSTPRYNFMRKSLVLASAERADQAAGILRAAADDLEHAAGLDGRVPVESAAEARRGALGFDQ